MLIIVPAEPQSREHAHVQLDILVMDVQHVILRMVMLQMEVEDVACNVQ